MKLPKIIPIFPLSNFIVFPKTAVPLNIFEPRYLEMVNESMKAEKFIGMVQPKTIKNFDNTKLPILHKIGCLGKINSFKETDDGRYLIELKGLIRFKIVNEITNNKNGFLIENNNRDELVNAMKISMLNKKSLRRKAIKSREDSKKFSLNKMIGNHIEIYKKLILK